jgi:hypothetical protein
MYMHEMVLKFPSLKIWTLRAGFSCKNCRLPNGGMLEIAKVYALDAVFDTPEDVPEDVSSCYLLLPLSMQTFV